MTIARKPSSKQTMAPEGAANRFISGAGQGVSDAPADDLRGTRKPVMIRFDRELLARVDKAAKRRGINRSAWISYVISTALENE
jgi:hypothetical protein